MKQLKTESGGEYSGQDPPLIVRRLVDRSDLLDGLAAVDGPVDTGWVDPTLGHADEVRRPEPGSRRPKLPGSRDFQ